MFRCSPVVWCNFALLIACATTGTAAETGSWIRGVFTGSSPRPLVATEEVAWQRASEMAENVSGGFVLVGSGRSMQPLYEPDTILVLQHLPFNELRRGQTALYRNREGKVIAHVLVSRTRDGWRARGLNNRLHDMEPVLSENLVGVVIAAFKPVAGKRPVSFAALH
jgi:hypothetical protein